MKGHFISAVAALSVAFVGAGLLMGSIPWVGLAAAIIGFSISELIRSRKRNQGEVVEAPNDERVSNNVKQFAAYVLLLAHLLLFGYLVVAKYVTGISLIRIDYLIIYVVVTFFILITGGAIVERK
ncbi:hypothetical protein [Halobacillus halophilus]|uniref:hypothetical protein n=1 Tax=Halobacillus halophilus TaxID=1570 RepID=UPI001CD5C94C|nr:hypothetical protein [Halobacillus halophilus]MCA1012795.1 hypothetical protein [Halobacillus halophilus]